MWRDGRVRRGPAVAFDLDGVISDAAHRQHLLRRDAPDWSAFFRAAAADPVIERGRRLAALIASEVIVAIVTARPVDVFDLTVDWLARHEVRWDLLVMRGDGDERRSSLFKADVVDALARDGIEVRLALDDDGDNVATYEGRGIPALYVHSGYYENSGDLWEAHRETPGT
ncbi:MAG: hypothetical protein D6683_17000 [Actinomyces sp.]|nr:MAG: hypothetical protein D6683_17000 [Actinomyces sp.]